MRVWIYNHYATNMYITRDGRHYNFAKNLLCRGIDTLIFCSNRAYKRNYCIDVNNDCYNDREVDNVKFIFVKTTRHLKGDYGRMEEMITYYRNLFPVARKIVSYYGAPDVIIASSVHPLALVAGIKIAKRLHIPCICEIRDLWPESLVAYGRIKSSGCFTKLLYKGEKWIYTHADRIVFTMEGGIDYIVKKGWDSRSGGPIDITKAFHINNGIDLDKFNENKRSYTVDDYDVNRSDCFKVVYAGSIGRANNVQKIVEAAEVLANRGIPGIIILIFGDGPEKSRLEQYCRQRNLTNIIFKGSINKSLVPYVLSNCDLNIYHYDKNSVAQYGISLNKIFDYLASGKPILSDCRTGYDLIERYQCGKVVDGANAEQLADAIVSFTTMSRSEYDTLCKNAVTAAEHYDYKRLTDKLEEIIRGVVNKS